MDLSRYSEAQLQALLNALANEERDRKRYARLEDYIPYPKQQEFHANGIRYRERMLAAGNQLGKELPVTEPVLTPTGWRPIGALVVGDEVIAGDGSVTEVTGVFPQGVKPMVAMTTDYLHTLVSGNDHQWLVLAPPNRFRTRSETLRTAARGKHTRQVPNETYGQWKVTTTAAMRAAYGDNPSPRNRFLVPHVGVVQFPAKPVPIDPYVFGVLLGDGCLRANPPRVSTADPEVIEAFKAAGFHPKHLKAHDWSLSESPQLKRDLEALGVWGTFSYEKSIPEVYLINEPAVRLAVLQGLMDTDGTCEKSGAVSFTSTSAKLTEDVAFLARSFGAKCWTKSRITSCGGKPGRRSWTVVIRQPEDTALFRLARKLARTKVPVSTTPDHVVVAYHDAPAAEAVCISVAHESRTYVTRDFVVTHNTFAAAAETTYHLTGRYPHWWKGIRFSRPVTILAGSESGELTRDGMQRLLVGPPSIEDQWGSGMIPRDALAAKPKRRAGVKDAIDAVVVNSVHGGQSVIRFKSFDQGRSKWQADTVDAIWLDEEPPYDVYEEAITRTNTTNGPIYITFTPLKGMSEVVRKFFQEPGNDRIVTQMTIDDVDHYTPEQKAKIIASYDDATRDARTKGIPVLGSGLVFPVPEDMIKIDPIQIPDHWPRGGAMDFGWDHPFAAVEMAWDRDQDVLYLTREYRESKQTPAGHATVLRQWGNWLPWMWPHDGHKTWGSDLQGSGLQLAKQYKTAGLHMHQSHVTFDDGSIGVEAGIMEMLTRMREGRFKVFSTCTMWLGEKSLYHRKDGQIVKLQDDLISASRYGLMGRRFFRVKDRRVAWGNDFRNVKTALGTGEVSL